jgi:hypothetical protein
MSTATPKLTPQEYGRIGARRRWGEPKTATIKLDTLSPDQRRIVVALLDAVRNNEKAAPERSDDRDAAKVDGNLPDVPSIL